MYACTYTYIQACTWYRHTCTHIHVHTHDNDQLTMYSYPNLLFKVICMYVCMYVWRHEKYITYTHTRIYKHAHAIFTALMQTAACWCMPVDLKCRHTHLPYVHAYRHTHEHTLHIEIHTYIPYVHTYTHTYIHTFSQIRRNHTAAEEMFMKVLSCE